MRIVTTLLILSLAGQGGPTFDVVSIKRNTGGVVPGNTAPPIQRPDGGLTLKNQPIRSLIARAYPGMDDIVGLPDWATNEHYDVAATSTLTTATADDRIAMLRAMLADRFQLNVHIEKREQPVFDLVLARRDGKLGPGLTRSDTDCSVRPERAPGPVQRPDFTKPPPPCSARMMGATLRGDGKRELGDLFEGELTMATFAENLRPLTRRSVIDKTGLSGTYRIAMNYDMMTTVRPASTDPPPDAGPSAFTAIQEQLGLKLEPSKTMRDVLVIDRLERPTPN